MPSGMINLYAIPQSGLVPSAVGVPQHSPLDRLTCTGFPAQAVPGMGDHFGFSLCVFVQRCVMIDE